MTTETGHAKNVALFATVLTFCESYGSSYNPVNPGIKLTALQAKHHDASDALTLVNTTYAAWTHAIKAREIFFDPLKKMVTRILNAAAASGISNESIKNIRIITKKLQGKRATPVNRVEPTDPPPAQSDSVKTISASQMSFDSRIENMSKLIQLLSTYPVYIPNEPDLNLAGLNTLLNNMKSSNTIVVNAYTDLSNARILRNRVLYEVNTGVYDLVISVKSYLKSVFGTTSPEYKQLSKIQLTHPRVR